MADETVEITIDPDGRVEMTVSGVPGMDCLAETDELVRLLGGQVERQQLTAEAYQETEQHDQERLWH